MKTIREVPKCERTDIFVAFDNLDLEGVKFSHDEQLVIKHVIDNS